MRAITSKLGYYSSWYWRSTTAIDRVFGLRLGRLQGSSVPTASRARGRRGDASEGGRGERRECGTCRFRGGDARLG